MGWTLGGAAAISWDGAFAIVGVGVNQPGGVDPQSRSNPDPPAAASG